jgi:hypothetical protein
MVMQRMTEQELTQKLSLFLDGALSESETDELERYLAEYPDAAAELRELKAVQQLLQSRPALKPDIGFWTRLSVAIDEMKAEEQNLLPFPRRFIPAATLVGALSMVIVGVILFRERDSFFEFISKTSEDVQLAYEGSLLRGAITPLLANIDKDQTLQFALFGSLQLDEQSETSLRVDETTDQGYRIEVGKKEDVAQKLTLSDLYTEIEPTQKQAEVIDSVLQFGQKQLVRSVLVAENQAVAIGSDLPRLSRVMVSGIAASLEPQQRVRLEKFLQQRNAAYSIVASQEKAAAPEEILGRVRRPHRPERFVVLTPDTMLIEHVALNFDSIHREAARSTRSALEAHARAVENVARQIRMRHPASGTLVVGTTPVHVSGDERSFTIEVRSEEGDDKTFLEGEFVRVVKPRFPKPGARFERRVSVGGETYGPTFPPFDTQFDSLWRWVERETPEGHERFRILDSVVLKRLYGDSPKSYGPKLDSLMRKLELERAALDSVSRALRRQREP